MSGESHDLVPLQLPFDKLKRVASRLLLVESYAALSTAVGSAELEGLHQLQEGVSVFDARRSALGDRLDAHLRAVVAEATRVAGELSQAARDGLGPVLTELLARGTAVDCGRCAQGRSSCSHGGADNDHNVHAAGECLGPIKQHFADVQRAVRWQVAQAGLDGRHPELALALRHSEGRPHDLRVHYQVSGTHRAADLPDRARGIVELTFQIDALDVLTYRAVTYVLFHELVCHAWDGVAARLPRTKPLDADGFADGWMDLVATRALASWLNGEWAGAPAPPNDGYDREGIAWAFHRARIEPASSRLTGPQHQRAAGAEAARRFLQMFARRYPAEATDLLVCWSLYLSIHRPPRRGWILRWNPADRHSDQLVDLIRDGRYAEAWNLVARVFDNQLTSDS